MSLHHSFSSVGLLLMLCLVAPPALTQLAGAAPSPSAPAERTPPSDQPPATAERPLGELLTGEAKTEYEAGKVLFLDGDPAGSLVKFRRAYELSKEPRLLWNMAACEKTLRHYAKAQVLVERYLLEGGPALSAAEAGKARALLGAIRPYVSELVIAVSVPGAQVYVDGEPVGTSPLPGPVRVDIGQRAIRVVKAQFKEFVQSQNVPGGSPVRVDVQLAGVVHDGQLRITTDGSYTIRVDGKEVGVGDWSGRVPSGVHSVRVTAPHKQPYQGDVLVEDGQTATVRVNLQAEAAESRGPLWPWIAGGVVAAVGLGVGGYFLFRPEDKTRTQSPFLGSLPPGTVTME
jgi:hypothetical protein